MLPNVYFGEVVFKPNHATKLLPVNLISCKMFIQLFLLVLLTFYPYRDVFKVKRRYFSIK